VNNKALENMEGIVNRTIKSGAELLTGGESMMINNKGYFFPSNNFQGCDVWDGNSTRRNIWSRGTNITASDENEAIRIANDSKFGFGASIWTQDLEKAEKLSSMIESGIVTVNSMVVSDPRVPSGGIKNSGFGRELSTYGLLEFVNIKSVRFYDQLIYDHHVE
jgi:acyl-CoA reductase-like NAD-dependent aldehyde dehydrogenase